MEPISTVLATRICLELFFGNLQRCNRVYPKARPGSSQRSEHANLEHSPRMRFVRLICSCRTNESENESTSDSTKDDANFHKFASILASATLSRMTLSGVEFLVVEPSNIHHEGTKVAKNSTFIKVPCVFSCGELNAWKAFLRRIFSRRAPKFSSSLN